MEKLLNDKEYYSRAETAQMLRKGIRTVDYLRKTGRITATIQQLGGVNHVLYFKDEVAKEMKRRGLC